MAESKGSKRGDPRDSSKETKVCLPLAWREEPADILGSGVMLFSGWIMLSRNRYFAWPAVLLALNTSINNHYLRMKDGGSPSSGLIFAVGAFIACYLPLFIPGL